MHPPKGYKFISLLGRGQATTWLAESIVNGGEVVIKTLELNNVSNWKGIELFEREVDVLQQLDHPSIPKFIDFIKDEHEGAHRWHIVQEKVEGKALDPTSSWSEDELRDLAKSVLESLVYLQSFSPPLLHRDIKPGNLIRKETRHSLIDFGAVRHVVPSDVGGSTVVGTSGYMAPEQLMGRADTSSDLYGLGMTLIHLLSGKHPDEFGKNRMHIQWSEYQNKLSDDFVGFVNQLTEPHTENRFGNAKEALERLSKPTGPPEYLIRRAKSWVKISLNKERDMVRFRATRLRLAHTMRAYIGLVLIIPFFGLCMWTAMSILAATNFVDQLSFLLLWVASAIVVASCFVTIERIKLAIPYSGKLLRTSDFVGRKLLTKSETNMVNYELRRLRLRYIDAESKSENTVLNLQVEDEKNVDVLVRSEEGENARP